MVDPNSVVNNELFVR